MRIPKLTAGLSFISIMAMPAAAQRGRGAPVVVDSAATADIVVRPVRNGSQDVQYVDIHEVFGRSAGATHENLTFQVPNPPPGAPPAGLEVIEATDANGALPVRIDRSAGRRWRTDRAVKYPLTITFKARMWPPGTPTNPSPMLRTAGGAVSGQGSGILVIPNDGVNYAARFRWDLSDLAPGSITTSGLDRRQ